MIAGAVLGWVLGYVAAAGVLAAIWSAAADPLMSTRADAALSLGCRGGWLASAL